MEPCRRRQIFGYFARRRDAGLLVRLGVFQHLAYLAPRVQAIDKGSILADGDGLTRQSENFSKSHPGCRSGKAVNESLSFFHTERIVLGSKSRFTSALVARVRMPCGLERATGAGHRRDRVLVDRSLTESVSLHHQ